MTNTSSVAAPQRRAGIVDRLYPYEFELVGPGADSALVVESVRSFRTDVYRGFGSLPPVATSAAWDDAADRVAWHIVAKRGPTIVGCLRAVVYQTPFAPDVPDRVVHYSGCAFSQADRKRCLRAIHAFIRTRRASHSPLIQFGGLAVSARARRSALPIGLCLAATAFTRACGSGGGVFLAAEKSRTETLFRRAGGFRLRSDGEHVAPLDDSSHRDRVVLMGSDPFGNAKRLESVIVRLESAVIGPHVRKEAPCA